VLKLTPQGRQTWRRVKTVIQRRNEEIVACLSDVERQQLDQLLDKLVAHAVSFSGDTSDAAN
jgi:DNA-binding MarR family transcriptional regulator